MLKKFYQSISFRLISYVLLVSMAMSLIGTKWTLDLEYKRQSEIIDAALEQAKKSYSNSLSVAVWDIDETQIDVQLKSFLTLPDIIYIKIETSYKDFEMGNKPIGGNFLKKSYPLILPKTNNNPIPKTVGSLQIIASLENIDHHLKEKAIAIFLTETTKVLLLSFVIVFLSRLMITRHLMTLADYAKQLDLDHLDVPIHLFRVSWLEPQSQDEFSNMVSAFNEMRIFLKQELHTRQEAEKALKELNEQLEEKIRQRTVQVEHSNTELKKTLSQLQSTQRQLVENEKMAALGGLVAGIAHEVNTPVGIGVTAASHLKQLTDEMVKLVESKQVKKTDLDNYLHAAIESSNILMKNLNRAATIVQSFKQVAVDQTSQESRLFNVKEYIQEILTSLSPKLKNTKHIITVDCDPGLSVLSDPGTFSHVLTNLIMNSLIHAYEPNHFGQLKIKIQSEKSDLILTYSDDGKGIPSENLGKIFDPFFTTKRGSGGTGLGLHILFNMVSQGLGGTVTCHSEFGKGTEFVIQFPVKGGAS